MVFKIDKESNMQRCVNGNPYILFCNFIEYFVLKTQTFVSFMDQPQVQIPL